MDEQMVQDAIGAVAGIASLVTRLVGASLAARGKSEEEIRAVTAAVSAGIEAKLAELRATPWATHPDETVQ